MSRVCRSFVLSGNKTKLEVQMEWAFRVHFQRQYYCPIHVGVQSECSCELHVCTFTCKGFNNDVKALYFRRCIHGALPGKTN